MAKGSGDLVVTVSLQANEGNVSQVFNLTAQNAQKLGKAIGDAFKIDNANSLKALSSLNDSVKFLAKNAIDTRNALKNMGDFPYKQTQNNLNSITKSLSLMQGQANKTGESLRDVKFVIGQSNTNIKSVITQLERLEQTAKRVGNVSIGINTQGSGGRTTSGGSTTQSVSTTPTITKSKSEYQPQYGPFKEEAIKTSAVISGQINAGAESLKRLSGMTNDVNKQLGGVVNNATKAGTEAVNGFSSKFSGLVDTVTKVSQQSQSRFSQIFAANFFAGIAYNAVSSFLKALERVSFETVTYAARTQELGVALNSLARVNDISTESITQQEEAIKRLNITTQDARESLARFINVGFDIKAAAPLARVAQDLAVISGVSTSEELNKLIIGIQTLQSRNLRTAGVFLTVDEVLDRLSATTGRARDSFSTLEKQQAVLNAVMEYGGKVAGTYEAAMTTASKQMRSLERNFYEAQNALGEAFIPTLGLGVTAATKLLQAVAQYPDIFTRAIGVIGLFTAAVIALRTNAIKGAVVGLTSLVGSTVDTFRGLTGGQTAQQALLVEKKAELEYEKLILIAKEKNISATLQQLQDENLINNAKYRQLEAERNLVNKKLATNEVGLAQVGVQGIGDKIAGVVGKAAIVGAVALSLYEIGKSIYEISTAPEPIITQDVNSIKKQADDTKLLIEARNKISTNGITIKDIEASINGERIVGLGILKEQNNEVEKQKGLLQTLNAQIDANQAEAEATKAVASRNIISSFQELSNAQKERDRLANLYKQQKSGPNFSGINPETGGFQTLDITSSTLEGYSEASKKAEEDSAKFFSSLKDGSEIAAAYNITLDELIDIQAKIKFKDNADGLAKFNQELIKYKAQLADESFQAANKQFLSPEGRFKEISESYQKGLAEQIKNVREQQTELRNSQIAATGKSEINVDEVVGRVPKLYAESFAKSKENIEAFFTTLSQGISKEESEGKKFTYPEKIARFREELEKFQNMGITNPELKKLIEENPELEKGIKDVTQAILGQGTVFKDNSELAKNYFTSMYNLGQELQKVNQELDVFLNQSPEQRKIGFEIEAKKEDLSTFKSISQLEYELGKKPTNLNRFDNNIKEAKRYQQELTREKKITDDITSAELRLQELRTGSNSKLENLQRQIKIEEAIHSAKVKQFDVETDIEILQKTATIPLVNSELLVQKAILEEVKKRREAEQQLTVDIATEIDKRRRYSISSAQEISRISAEVFLDAQKQENQTQEEALKNVLGLALQTGNTSVFENNPLIKEAVKQSERMEAIDKKGGLQVVKIEEGNQIAGDIKDASIKTNDLINTLITTFTNGINLLLESNSKLNNIPGTTNFDRIYNAFTQQESSGNPFVTPNKRTGAAGIGQIVEKYYQSYANLAGVPNTTFAQYKKDPTLQRTVVYNSLQRLYQDALQQAGGDERLAIKMLASRWYTGSFGNYNSTKIPAPGEPSPQQYSNSVLARTLGINLLSSPTQSVISNIKSSRASSKELPNPHPKITYEEYGNAYGLTPEEYNRLLEISNIQTVDEAKTVFSSASLFKQYGDTFAQGADAQALGDFAKDTTSKLKEQDVQRAMIRIRKLNAQMIIDLDTTAQIIEYEKELGDFESGITTSDTLTKLSILKDRVANLDDKTSSEYNKVIGDTELARAQRFYDLKSETIKLDNEEYYRTVNRESYLMEQARKFSNDQLNQKQSIEDANSQLYEREKNYLNENSQLRKNILAEELRNRREAKQTLTEELDALKRYSEEYLNSEENRKRIYRETDRDRLKSYIDLTESIIKLDADYGHANDNLTLELLENSKKLRNSREEELKQLLIQQQTNEDTIKHLTDDNSQKIRTNVQSHITDAMKSNSDIVSGLWNDTFDGISNGFGGLIDKMTSKLGIFKGAVGNFLKSMFDRTLGGVFNNILDKLFPRPDELNINKGITEVSDSTSSSILQLGYAASEAAQALLTIAGQGITTMGNISDVVTSKLSSFASSALGSITHGVGGAASGSLNLGSLLRGLLTSGLSSLANSGVSSSVANSVSSSINLRPLLQLPSLPGGIIPFNPSQTVSGGTRSLAAEIAQKALSGASPSGASSIGGFLDKLGLKGIGTQLLQSAPLLGASLGGMLGGSSGLGSFLGQAGGLLGGLVLAASTGAIGGSIGGLFALSGALGPFALAAAPLLLIGGWLLGRNKLRRQEETIRNTAILDAFSQIDDLIKQVKTDKMNGDDAITQAQAIRKQYVDQMSQLKDKKTRSHALQDVSRIDTKIDELKKVAADQTKRQELDTKIVPTYATGGVSNNTLIRVSRGEKLYSPSSVVSMRNVFANAGIPGIASGGVIGSHFSSVTIPGQYDGKDDILVNVPRGTVIANPRQQAMIRAQGYASGGVQGTVTAPAAQSVSVQAPPVNAIIVMSPEEAERLAAQIPNSIIVNKVRSHVKQTGTNGLVGDIYNEMIR